MIASQISFDYSVPKGVHESYSEVEHAVTEALENIGIYVLGVLVNADEVDWSSSGLEDYDMSQCGVDFFISKSGGDQSSSNIEAVIKEVIEDMGFEFWGMQGDTVYYDNSIIDDVADWEGMTPKEVRDDILDYYFKDEV